MNAWRDALSLPRSVWPLFAATLVNRAGAMALPFLVLYLVRERGFTPGDAGAVLAVYGVGALAAGPVAAVLISRWGPMTVMRASLLGTGAFQVALPFATSTAVLVALVAAWAIVAEIYRPASFTLLAEDVPPERRRQAFAVLRLAVNRGMSVGPAAGGFLAEASFRSVFLVDGVTTLAAAGVLLALGRSRRTRSPNRTSVVAAFRDRRFLLAWVGVVLVAMIFFQSESSVPVFLVEELRLPMSAYGLLATVNTVLIVAFELPLTSALARRSAPRVAAVGALLTGIGFGAFFLARGVLSAAVAVVLFTVGEMVFSPTATALVAELAPVAERGVYMAAYNTAWSLAFAVGPWVGTASVARLGRAHWLAVAGAGVLAALVFAFAGSGVSGTPVRPLLRDPESSRRRHAAPGA